MKYLSFILSLLFIFNVSAFDSGRDGLRCRAYDKGWEEHFGGHSSCSSCLSKHGECVEKCYEDEYTYTAEGENRYGELETVMASGMDKYRTKSRALDRCYDRRLNGCRIVDKDKDSHLVRSRTCRDDRNNHNTCSFREYYRQRPDVKAAGMDPLTHYRRHGKSEGMCRPVRR